MDNYCSKCNGSGFDPKGHGITGCSICSGSGIDKRSHYKTAKYMNQIVSVTYLGAVGNDHYYDIKFINGDVVFLVSESELSNFCL